MHAQTAATLADTHRHTHIHLTVIHTHYCYNWNTVSVLLYMSCLSIQSVGVLVDSNMKWALVPLVSCQSVFCCCYCDEVAFNVSIMDFIIVSAAQQHCVSASPTHITLLLFLWRTRAWKYRKRETKGNQFDISSLYFELAVAWKEQKMFLNSWVSSNIKLGENMTIWNETYAHLIPGLLL